MKQYLKLKPIKLKCAKQQNLGENQSDQTQVLL